MSGYESDQEYDLFNVTPKMGWGDKPVESRNGKSRLLIFHNILDHDGTKSDIEVWVPKNVSKFKKQPDGTIVAQIESWWVKTKEELA